MKRISVLCLLMAGMVSCSNDKQIPQSELPSEVTTFLKKIAPNTAVSAVLKDSDFFFWNEYEVFLADGTKVEFNNSEWKKITMAPQSNFISLYFIPKNIFNYIEMNFPFQNLSSLEKTKNGFSVELANDIELNFDQNGNFIRIDD